jgi:hypothetical protein
MSSYTHDKQRPIGSLNELSKTEAHAIGHLMFATALTVQVGTTPKALRAPRALAAVIRMVIQDNYPSLHRSCRADAIMGAAYAASLHTSLHTCEDNQLAQEMGRASTLLNRVPWAGMEHLPELLVFDGLEGVAREHSFSMRIVPHGDPVIDESLGRITLCPKPCARLLADLRAAYPLASISIQS